MSFGGNAFLAQLASSLIERSGVLLLGVLGPVTAVTVFAIAASLIDYVRALAGGIRTTLAPRASALEGLGHAEALRGLTLQGARYTSLLAPIWLITMIRRAHWATESLALARDAPV